MTLFATGGIHGAGDPAGCTGGEKLFPVFSNIPVNQQK
jgi:hypothetical protein